MPPHFLDLFIDQRWRLFQFNTEMVFCMHNPFIFFNKIQCINLDSRPDRWDTCLALANEYGLNNFNRFKAVECSGPLEKLKLNRLGCALSFYKILAEARLENLRNVLIFEDDFFFLLNKDETFSRLQKSLSDLPDNWDMFYLGANVHNGHRSPPVSKFSDNLIKLESAYALHAVSFSCRGIEKFFEFFPTEPVFVESILNKYSAIDVFFAIEYLHANNCFITPDILVGQRSDKSDIEGWLANYTPYMVQQLGYFKSLI